MLCDTPGKSGLCFSRVGGGIGGVGGGWGRRYRGEVSVGMRDPQTHPGRRMGFGTQSCGALELNG